MPGPVLAAALDFVDQQLGALLTELRSRHLDRATTVILSAKHGQGPTDPALLNRIDDGPILDGLNAAWQAAHPGAGPLVAHAADDDAMLLWLTDRSPAATDLARRFLLAHTGTGTGVTGSLRPYTRSGVDQLFTGTDAAAYFHVPVDDSRVPDVVGLVTPGVVYTGGTTKIAEHGGASGSDRNVPIVVVSPGEAHSALTMDQPVETTQIAPTILRALGLDPGQLAAVNIEHTATLGTP
jgi:arylsulfatase A-like enzyme